MCYVKQLELDYAYPSSNYLPQATPRTNLAKELEKYSKPATDVYTYGKQYYGEKSLTSSPKVKAELDRPNILSKGSRPSFKLHQYIYTEHSAQGPVNLSMKGNPSSSSELQGGAIDLSKPHSTQGLDLSRSSPMSLPSCRAVILSDTSGDSYSPAPLNLSKASQEQSHPTVAHRLLLSSPSMQYDMGDMQSEPVDFSQKSQQHDASNSPDHQLHDSRPSEKEWNLQKEIHDPLPPSSQASLTFIPMTLSPQTNKPELVTTWPQRPPSFVNKVRNVEPVQRAKSPEPNSQTVSALVPERPRLMPVLCNLPVTQPETELSPQSETLSSVSADPAPASSPETQAPPPLAFTPPPQSQTTSSPEGPELR